MLGSQEQTPPHKKTALSRSGGSQTRYSDRAPSIWPPHLPCFVRRHRCQNRDWQRLTAETTTPLSLSPRLGRLSCSSPCSAPGTGIRFDGLRGCAVGGREEEAFAERAMATSICSDTGVSCASWGRGDKRGRWSKEIKMRSKCSCKFLLCLFLLFVFCYLSVVGHVYALDVFVQILDMNLLVVGNVNSMNLSKTKRF